MAGRKKSRDDLHWSRRKAFYLRWIRDSSKPTHRISRASNYVCALLIEADPEVGEEVGDRVVRSLLAAAATLEPKQRGRRR